MNRPVKYRRIYDRQGRPGIEVDPVDANKAWKEQQEIDAALATLSDEKLEEYLGIWNKLVDQGHREMLDHITSTANYDCSRFPFGPWIYTLTYGEEKRELTYEQFWRVKAWLESLPRE